MFGFPSFSYHEAPVPRLTASFTPAITTSPSIIHPTMFTGLVEAIGSKQDLAVTFLVLFLRGSADGG